MEKIKVVIAIDSLKGSLSSVEAGNCIRAGILRAIPDADVLVSPMRMAEKELWKRLSAEWAGRFSGCWYPVRWEIL